MKAREAEAEAAMGDLAAALMRGGSMPVLAARSVLDALERHDDLMELDASVLEAVQRMDASAQGVRHALSQPRYEVAIEVAE